jgi:hypothetical protein
MIAAAMSKPLARKHGGALKLHRIAGFGGVSSSPHHHETSVFPEVPQTGTGLAIDYITIGVAANIVAASLSRKRRRGGAHNSASRESCELSTAQVRNLMAAAAHAEALGLPLTRMITVHWEAAGVPLAGMVRATGRFTDLLSKALARHGSKVAWIWAHENGDGKGGHCHLLIHGPARLAGFISRKQKAWLRNITGRPYTARVIRSRPVGGHLGLEISNHDLHAANLTAALLYILKGASGEAAAEFHLPRLEPGGRIIGKRCGTSQNIGAKARRTGKQ